MSSSANIPHRTISSIRGGAGSSKEGVPHTPARPHSSSIIGSPSGGRVEEDVIVIELGCRNVRVGFAGDYEPKRIITFDADSDKRVGDLRAWEAGYAEKWRERLAGRPWGFQHELFQLDCRGQDMALVGDKLERGLRDAFATHLLLDSTKPKKISLVLTPALPLPIISSVIDTIFIHFQAPSISLLSSPVATTFAAGIRSALVVDIGWHETTVTGIYEYREVNTMRSTRAGKMLLEETRNFLVDAIQPRTEATQGSIPTTNDVVDFEDCEEVATRMLWCKKAHRTPIQDTPLGLHTLHEQDENEGVDPTEDTTPTPIYLSSCSPPKTLQIPFSKLAEPCEATFFQTPYATATFDDEELPIHLLVYLVLLKLPMDVRAICMSRIIFTGGCSKVLGLRRRVFDELRLLVEERGWDPVQGRGVQAYRNNPKLKRNGGTKIRETPIPSIQTPEGSEDKDETPTLGDPSLAPAEEDPVNSAILKEKGYKPPVQGTLRVIDSMGPWIGASLATQLKISALAAVERDLWMQQGLNGASKPNEIDAQAQQTRMSRQSMGPGGLAKSQGNWTLGVWGAV
ncbi:hypothetical protein PFICI_09034 [Pestalotiopsis fici W106-1]|uniref:Actin-related protein RO7 n=1 Tax=Pestalotiopsis fici (strain W106-1 / CGMCC3.15140) TaxID=1229662 RepID=W3X1Y8_PESFW|nr:uncharacterized protein PFICI_09034 [Pestalotiopsis fici W106-1]ETS79181.1 hypothetical protein PFICI_09034 [Pestalotiopsis fici W106-1]